MAQVQIGLVSYIGKGKEAYHVIRTEEELHSIGTDYKNKTSAIILGTSVHIYVSIKEAELLVAALQDSLNRLTK